MATKKVGRDRATPSPASARSEATPTTSKGLLQKVTTYDRELEAQLIKARDYEELDRYILCHLSGTKY